MLKQLSVKNYALIDELEIAFSNGFSVITGETGSGKSIMLGALGLILGERADSKALRDVTSKCIIEGSFELSQTRFKSFFDKNDIDFEPETVLRREITPSGKSRAFVNDTPVMLTLLKELGESLIDIHSQHQTLLLNKSDFQFEVVDTACNALLEKEKYHQVFEAYKDVEKRLHVLKEREHKAISDRDYITFQLKDFEGVALEEISHSDIEEELNLLSNAEEVISLSNQITEELNGEQSIITTLQSVEQAFIKLSEIDKNYLPLLERIQSSLIELKDVDDETSKKMSSIDMNENRLSELSELFDTINQLQRKHNVNTVEELLRVKESLSERFSVVDSLSEEIEVLTEEQKLKLSELNRVGKELSQKRKKGIPSLQDEVKKYLGEMAMPYAELKVQLTDIETPSENGLEAIEFLIKTNKGSSFEPLAKVASGGELSRIMLAIKSILCVNGNLPAIIFDEIDTGVSGEVANNMGSIMQKMAEHLQVVSITHLPQIASKGKHHYKVFKETTFESTITKIVQLQRNERLVEIAQMLSGENPSQAAIDNARELLN